LEKRNDLLGAEQRIKEDGNILAQVCQKIRTSLMMHTFVSL
jgi:hypothetical protein